MISPADMPKKRPEHTFRPPRRKPKPVPQWRCLKQGYRSEAEADAALGEIWSTPRGDQDPMECRAYRCPRHQHEVWHLTSQPARKKKGRSA